MGVLFFFMVNVVNKGLKVEILPDNNMMQVLNQNIGNARFIWNNMLSRYNDLYEFFSSHDLSFKSQYWKFKCYFKDVKARAFFFT